MSKRVKEETPGGVRFANAVAKRIVCHMRFLQQERDALDKRIKQWEDAWNSATPNNIRDFETCSYCHVPFEVPDDYDWACAYTLDSGHHKIWCNREGCTTEGDLIQCDCGYGVCRDCLIHCTSCANTPHCPTCPCDNNE